MDVFFAWLVDVDGDLALIDPRESILRERERERERGFGQDQREDSKENPMMTLKLAVLVPTYHGIEAHEHKRHSTAATSQSRVRPIRQPKPQEVQRLHHYGGRWRTSEH